MPTSIAGRCLCGGVQFVAQHTSASVGACHCGLCRRWGGGPLLALDGEGPEFQGSEHIAVFATSPRAERGFCAICGTHLFIRIPRTGRYIFPAGLFELGAAHFDHQIFIDEKPSYYGFANQTRELTGVQFWAQAGIQPVEGNAK